MTQTEMAKKLGISQGQVSKLLAGKDLGRKSYKKVAAGLGNGHKWHDIAGLDAAAILYLVADELVDHDRPTK